MHKTNIGWADCVLNPQLGCTHAGSPGCDHCYAKALHDQRHKAYRAGKRVPECYCQPFETVRLLPERLKKLTPKQTPRTIFVGSMTDMFVHRASPVMLDAVFGTVEDCCQHTYLFLTKRPQNLFCYRCLEPQPNWFFGVTIENEEWRVRRHLDIIELANKGWSVFLSVEPLLGPIDLKPLLPHVCGVIVGGESGKGARPMNPDWARKVRDDCQAANVPFFFKQWGDNAPFKGRELDGRFHNALPWPLYTKKAGE